MTNSNTQPACGKVCDNSVDWISWLLLKPRRVYALQPNVAASATLGNEEEKLSTATRLLHLNLEVR